MKDIIGGLLAPFAETMFDLVKAIPLGVVRALVFGILIALTLWVIRMAPQMPKTGEEKSYSIFRDLRFFAIGILFLQAILYILF